MICIWFSQPKISKFCLVLSWVMSKENEFQENITKWSSALFCVEKWRVHLNILLPLIEALGKTFISNHIKVSCAQYLSNWLFLYPTVFCIRNIVDWENFLFLFLLILFFDLIGVFGCIWIFVWTNHDYNFFKNFFH